MGNAVNRTIFRPPSPPSYTSSFQPKGALLQHVPTKYGHSIPVIFIDRSAEMTILYSHANAEDIGGIYDMMYSFADVWNVNILLYEYTGYGPSPCKLPSEQYVYSDVEAAYSFLTESLRIPSKRIIAYGRSIGSGPTCHIASQHNLGGVILQSAFLSIFKVLFGPHAWVPGDVFVNINKIPSFQCDILIIHGGMDAVVPAEHGRFLEKAARNVSSLWIDHAGHNRLEYSDPTLFHIRICKYFRQLECKFRLEETQLYSSFQMRTIGKTVSIVEPSTVSTDFCYNVTSREGSQSISRNINLPKPSVLMNGRLRSIANRG